LFRRGDAGRDACAGHRNTCCPLRRNGGVPCGGLPGSRAPRALSRVFIKARRECCRCYFGRAERQRHRRHGGVMMPVSRTDIIVVLVGLFAGYFLVSWLISRLKGDGRESAESTRRPVYGQGHWRDRDEPPPHTGGADTGSARAWYEV